MLAEYATVGYMAKRIQMQKNRYINMKKMLELAKLPNDPGVQVKESISLCFGKRPLQEHLQPIGSKCISLIYK